MYIEKLTKKDWNELEFMGLKPTEVKKAGDEVYICYNKSIGEYGFCVSDFSAIGTNFISEQDIDAFGLVYLDFMTQKFGKAYQRRLNKFKADNSSDLSI